MYVPVFSVGGAIGMCKLVHDRYGHMGKIKLLECMKERMFTPFLNKICVDVATTCESCQKGKYQRIYASPPVLKLSMNEPFELVVIDCVSYPMTARRNVGMIVMVDHKSKFAYAVPVKNKTSENVARVVSSNLLPMCVSKPVRMLSDNGPEFVGSSFERMLSEWNIEHVLTTPYMPSANGLAERTIRTLSEILRMMTEREDEWDLYVGRALSVYNSTVHKSIGMSPCKYLLNFERYVRPRFSVNEGDRDVWRKANERFESFKVGDKVLKEVIEKGRLNVNKMREKFEGPYVVKKVGRTGLNYVLEWEDEEGNIDEIRAHYTQLRRWREPPKYLVIHPINQMLEEEAMDVECKEKEDWLEGKQLVLLEKRKKKKHKSKKSVNRNAKDRTLTEWEKYFGISTEGKDFEGFDFEEELRDRSGIIRDLKEPKKVVNNNLDDELSLLLSEISCVLEEISVTEDPNLVTVINDVNVNDSVYEGPITRAKGSVSEYDWVM